LTREQLTLADLRRDLESQAITQRLRLNMTDRDWERSLQTLRSAAVLVWQRFDLQRAYEAFRSQNTPQGRADVPRAQPAPPRTPEWRDEATIHFHIFPNASNPELQRVARDAQPASQRPTADLRPA